MRPLRRSAKTASVAAAVALTASIATATPAHSAELNMSNLMKVATQADSIPCADLKTQLDKTKRVKPNTTRADLVKMANAELASKPLLRAAASRTINKVADRALACGLVKANNAGKPSQGNRAPGTPAKPGNSKPQKQADDRSKVSSLSSISSR